MPDLQPARRRPKTGTVTAGLVLCLLASAGCGGRQHGPVQTWAEAGPAPAPVPGAALDPTDASTRTIELPLTADAVASLLGTADQTAVRLDVDSVVLRRDELQVLVFLEDDGHTLQAVLPYIGLHAGDPHLIERWNASRRFGRAYLDHEAGPILACDLLLESGAPATLIQTWGRLFLDMADAFRGEVWPVGRPPDQPYAE